MTTYTKEDITGDSLFADLVVTFVSSYILMLAIGALGHQLDLPILFKVGYWSSFLLRMASLSLQRLPIQKWVTRDDR